MDGVPPQEIDSLELPFTELPELIERQFEQFVFVEVTKLPQDVFDIRGVLEFAINGNNLGMFFLKINMLAIEGLGLLFFGVGVEGDFRAGALIGEAGSELKVGLGLVLLFLAGSVV